jgi:hypothetical protein
MGMGRQAAVSLKEFQVQTGGDTLQLQQWQKAMNAVDVSSETTLRLFKSVKDVQAQIKLGQGPGAAFRFFGLDANEADTGKFLNQVKMVATKIQKDPNLVRQFSEMLGIGDVEFSGLLRANPARDQLSPGLTTTNAQVEDLLELDRQWQNLEFDAGKLGVQLATTLLPALKTIAAGLQWAVEKGEKFNEWLNRPENAGTAEAINTLAVSLFELATAFAVVAGVAATAWAAVKTWAFLVTLVNVILGLVKAAALWVWGFETVQGAVFLVTDSIVGLSASLFTLQAIPIVALLVELIWLFAHWEETINAVSFALEALFDDLKSIPGFKTIGNLLEGLPGGFTSAELTRPNGRPGVVGGNVTHNNNVTVHVSGADDPDATGKAVVQHFQRAVDPAYQSARNAAY